MSGPEIPLPKAPIISYFSNVSTPTRVRIVAARAILTLAIFCLLAFLALFFFIVYQFSVSAQAMMAWGGHVLTFRDFVEILWDHEFFSEFLIILVLLLAPGATLVILTGPVHAGRKIPSVLAMIFVVLPMIVLILATVYSFAITYTNIFTALGHPDFRYAPWFFLVPIGVLGILLLWDLCNILLWIARNPTTEKPSTPFLPGAGTPSKNA